MESIKGVAAIVADIANASDEQATGIEQVNKALTQMDEVTQQNSALVEENAATAKTLEQQAEAMNERVAFFQFDEGDDYAAPPSRQAAPARPAVSARPAAAPRRRPAAKSNGANGHSPVTRMQSNACNCPQGGCGLEGILITVVPGRP